MYMQIFGQTNIEGLRLKQTHTSATSSTICHLLQIYVSLREKVVENNQGSHRLMAGVDDYKVGKISHLSHGNYNIHRLVVHNRRADAKSVL